LLLATTSWIPDELESAIESLVNFLSDSEMKWMDHGLSLLLLA
jgi:hypothetical protein